MEGFNMQASRSFGIGPPHCRSGKLSCDRRTGCRCRKGSCTIDVAGKFPAYSGQRCATREMPGREQPRHDPKNIIQQHGIAQGGDAANRVDLLET